MSKASEKRYLSPVDRYHILDTKDESIIVTLWEYLPDSINLFKEEDAIYVPRVCIKQNGFQYLTYRDMNVFYLNLEFDEKDIIRNKPTETAEGSIQNINQDINSQAEAPSDKKQPDITSQDKSGRLNLNDEFGGCMMGVTCSSLFWLSILLLHFGMTTGFIIFFIIACICARLAWVEMRG